MIIIIILICTWLGTHEELGDVWFTFGYRAEKCTDILAYVYTGIEKRTDHKLNVELSQEK